MTMTSTAPDAERCRQIVRSFLDSWETRDLDRIVAGFADDAVYHNIPVAPIVGKPGICAIFAEFLRRFQEISLNVGRLVAEPGAVMVERVDRFLIDGRRIELPVTGVFVIGPAGIARFSDYFDLATFERLSGMKL